MKLGVLAASALIGVASFASASLAQGDGNAVMSRSARVSGDTDSAARIAIPDKVPTLESARPAAGMLPQPSGPTRGATSFSSNSPAQGTDIRRSLRRE
jgi:hypothetical protein